MKTTYKHEEQRIQTAIVKYLRLNRYLVFSIPNGINIPTHGSREIYQSMGLLSGVADLCIILPFGRTLWVEVKTERGRQSETQKAFATALEKQGHTYEIWRSLDDAINFVQKAKNAKM